MKQLKKYLTQGEEKVMTRIEKSEEQLKHKVEELTEKLTDQDQEISGKKLSSRDIDGRSQVPSLVACQSMPSLTPIPWLPCSLAQPATALQSEATAMREMLIHISKKLGTEVVEVKKKEELDESDQGGLFVGLECLAQFKGRGKFYPGKIASINSDGTVDVDFDDGDKEKNVERKFVDLKLGKRSKKQYGSSALGPSPRGMGGGEKKRGGKKKKKKT